MMLWKLRDRVFDELTQMPLAVEIVRSRRGILELQRSLFVLPVALDRLKEH